MGVPRSQAGTESVGAIHMGRIWPRSEKPNPEAELHVVGRLAMVHAALRAFMPLSQMSLCALGTICPKTEF
jgi:hypothetical protein